MQPDQVPQYTEADLIKARRAAWLDSAEYLATRKNLFVGGSLVVAREEADRRFPLPQKVREVEGEAGTFYRFQNGRLEVNNDGYWLACAWWRPETSESYAQFRIEPSRNHQKNVLAALSVIYQPTEAA
jgi:hypothetical protein